MKACISYVHQADRAILQWHSQALKNCGLWILSLCHVECGDPMSLQN